MNLIVNELSLNYGNYTALSDVQFEINRPRIYGLLGRNGAGKTSLLSILASFRKATSGSVKINGESPFENADIMQQVAFLYNKDYKDESNNLKSILQDTERYRPNFDMEYANYLVNRFKLDQKKPVKKFSKGMQSALNVIIGLAGRAPITIFDEVYLGMDAPSRDIFYQELLEEQQKHPRIFILSTHLVSEMDYLFDEVIMLDKGEIILHEDYDYKMTRRTKSTGYVEIMHEIVHTKKQIHTEHLGRTKDATIYSELTKIDKTTALKLRLEKGPITLH